MALIVGNKTFVNINPSSSGYLFAHTQDEGVGKYLLVSVCMPNTVDFTSVTYNGLAMSLLLNYNSASLSQRWAVFGLANPPAGNYNVLLTFSGTQWNAFSASVFSFTGCKEARVIGNNDIVTSPNSKTDRYNLNSIIYTFGVSGTNQSNPYTINGVNAALEFTHNVGSIVGGALSSQLASYGEVVVNTVADAGGSISNTRIELLEYTGGLVALNTEIGNNYTTFNNFQKGLIAINGETLDLRVLNTFVKGFIGISAEINPNPYVQNLVTPIEIV